MFKRKIKYYSENNDKLLFQTEQAIGVDVRANNIILAYKGNKLVSDPRLKRLQNDFEVGNVELRPDERVLFGTGLYVQLPKNTELQVRPRSGLSLKKGLLVSNTPGTIDPDYRGQIGIILHNITNSLVTVEEGERIAQIVPQKKLKTKFIEITSDEYNTNTGRGAGGFGSTGNK